MKASSSQGGPRRPKGSWRQRKNQRSLAWQRVTGVLRPATFMGESRTRRRCPGWGHRLFRSPPPSPPPPSLEPPSLESSGSLWSCHIGPSRPQCDMNHISRRSQKSHEKLGSRHGAQPLGKGWCLPGRSWDILASSVWGAESGLPRARRWRTLGHLRARTRGAAPRPAPGDRLQVAAVEEPTAATGRPTSPRVNRSRLSKAKLRKPERPTTSAAPRHP